MTPEERQEIDRLTERELPKAEYDYQDLSRIRETNRRAEEKANVASKN